MSYAFQLVTFILIGAVLVGCAAPLQAPLRESPVQLGEPQLIHDYCYLYVYGEQQDQRRAQTWCQQGADRGVASSQVLLAELYFFGIGVERDLFRALHWYQLAAQQGHAHAQFMLHHLYENGLGIPMDQARARHWLLAAAANGHLRAKVLSNRDAKGQIDDGQ